MYHENHAIRVLVLPSYLRLICPRPHGHRVRLKAWVKRKLRYPARWWRPACPRCRSPYALKIIRPDTIAEWVIPVFDRGPRGRLPERTVPRIVAEGSHRWKVIVCLNIL